MQLRTMCEFKRIQVKKARGKNLEIVNLSTKIKGCKRLHKIDKNGKICNNPKLLRNKCILP